ncbi:hypothetical protein Cfor_00482 [Coptotermes formosanus]|uniref:Uncharacterized protein n=1 Tax=Coptotermes formosanus TaxID=36987 RepID=A0A6L2PRK6_COPFO|nr:hypothetical protein Cfor_00482 [Coptotermes formosanus]
MEILHIIKKGNFMSTEEKFYIYSKTKCDNQINSKSTMKLHSNSILLQLYLMILEKDGRWTGSPGE